MHWRAQDGLQLKPRREYVEVCWVVEVVPHLPWALVEQGAHAAQHEDFVVDLVLPLAVRCQFGHDQGDPHGSPACAVEWLWVTDDDDCCLFTAG